MNTEINYWRDEKPAFTDEVVFVTAIFMKGHWHYTLWEMLWVDGEGGGYLGLHCDDGDEWGDYEDLRADKYLILTPPQKPEKK